MGGLFDFLVNEEENVQETQQNYVSRVITEGAEICEKQRWEEKYPQLVAGIESNDQQESYRNAYTAILMKNQAQFIERAAHRYGESTVSAFLGDVAPSILDVVRVFAPNTVSHLLANMQPMNQMNGQIIVIRPQFSNDGGGVSDGDIAFEDQTNGYYASEYWDLTLGTGDGGTALFADTANAVRPNTLTVTVAGTSVGTDDGSGNITGATIDSGSVDYSSGEVSVTFAGGSEPAIGEAVAITYQANSETDPNAIREMDLGLNVISVEAKPYPCRLTWSVEAALAATASIGLDVEDTATVIAGQLLKIERDRQLITYINNLAGSVNSNLVFDASSVAGYPRREVFDDFVIYLNRAGNEIFKSSGKGSVSWIVAGTDAATVMSSMKQFVAEPNVVPIGAHVIGSVNGVTIVKDPYMTTNEYTVGYNGILPGDSGVVVADWIPVYFTPTQQTADLVGRKALLSMYDIVSNITTYYKKGRITNI